MEGRRMADPKICVVGLGYVGLPLAVALARSFPVTGFDIDTRRIAELKAGRDRTGEVASGALTASTLTVSADRSALRGSNVYIITVPTPIDTANRPDLTALRSACAAVATVMEKGAIVVVESTVYPGVTEDICGPALEKASGLACGRDFHLGYSPERINPGDREHTVDRVMKVVAGQTPEVTELLARIYGAVTSGGVFRAASIKAAEAAKVIENAQRDINIAFLNEVTVIFNRLGLSIHDVLAAARTKWNFLPFTPGLVGGHCIGVDPFYLAECSQRLGHHPEVILAGRRINDGMAGYITNQIARRLVNGRAPGVRRVLVLGLTFKENVPDLRNSKVADVVAGLKEWGFAVDVHDPLADAEEARHEYGIELLPGIDRVTPYDCVVGAVAHAAYAALDGESIARLVRPDGILADIKGLWRGRAVGGQIERWEL
jgi:UDP-N-acetyl-D-galactosamine dehydrogenase